MPLIDIKKNNSSAFHNFSPIGCPGLQSSDLKDKDGRKIYLFNDGSFRSLKGSDRLQSRFKIHFLDSTSVSIKNILGEYLNPKSMEWTSDPGN